MEKNYVGRPKNSDEEQNKAMIRQYFELDNQKDLQEIEKLVSSKHRFYFSGMPPMDWNGHKHTSTDKPMSHSSFKGMSIALRLRDIFKPPHKILHQIDLIKEGSVVLDYGCGPGSYTIAAAQIVSSSGKVYAVDIHPMAIQEVQKKADMKGLTNIQTILTDDGRTKLPDSSVDVVLLFYVLHDFKDPDSILKKLNRILRHKGILCVIDHKLDNNKVMSIIGHATRGDLRLRRTGKEGAKKKESLLIFSKE